MLKYILVDINLNTIVKCFLSADFLLGDFLIFEQISVVLLSTYL